MTLFNCFISLRTIAKQQTLYVFLYIIGSITSEFGPILLRILANFVTDFVK
jgi:hypothetical protein